jgi:hypothetical protein
MSSFISFKFTGIEHNNCAPEHTRTVRKGSEISLQKQSTLEITNTSGFALEVQLDLTSKSRLAVPFVILDQHQNQLISFRCVLPANHVTNITLMTHYTKPVQEKDASVRNRSVLRLSVFGLGSQQSLTSADLPLKLLHASAKMRKVMFETLNLSSAGLSFTSSEERSRLNSFANVLVAQNILENNFSPVAGVFGLFPSASDQVSNAAFASPSGQENGQSVGFLFEESSVPLMAPESPASSSSPASASPSGFFSLQGDSTQDEPIQMTMADNAEPADPQGFFLSSSVMSGASSYSYFHQGNEETGYGYTVNEGDENDFLPPPPTDSYECYSCFDSTPYP